MLVVINIGVGSFVACSEPSNSTRGAAKPFKVALLTPGPISDQSWNGSAYAGLMRIQDSIEGAKVSHIQTKTPAEFEENFRQYGAAGYSLVIGHGFEFQDAAARVGPEFPKTIFVTTGGSTVGANVAAMSFSFDEPSYLAGIVAGSMTKSGMIGCIGGTELPPVKAAFAAFAAGAKSVNPRATVLVSYIGNWDDASAGKEQALAQLGRGADVIFQDADAAGLGAFQAVREARHAYIIGSNANQNAVAPEVTLGSVVIDLPHAFMLVAREVHSGHFKPRVMQMDMTLDVVRWTVNPAFASKIPAVAVHAVDSVRDLDAGRTVRAVPGDGSDMNGVQLHTVAAHLDALLRVRETAGLPAGTEWPSGRASRSRDEDCRGRRRVRANDSRRTWRPARTCSSCITGCSGAACSRSRERITRGLRLLLDHDVALYSAHLPLDAHPTFGNSLLLARELGLQAGAGFARHESIDCGVRGTSDIATSRPRVAAECVRPVARWFGGRERERTRPSHAPLGDLLRRRCQRRHAARGGTNSASTR